MPTHPTFSVIVPTYNQAHFLGQALESLLAQTDSDWEAVIVNDGSTDATAEVATDYCHRDARFRCIHKRNGGVASALNAGLAGAKGEWICWLSSDDLFDHRKLEIHRKWLRKHPHCRFFFSHFRYLNEATGQINDPDLWRDLPNQEWQVVEMLRGPYIHGNSICVHKDAFASVGTFDEELRYGQDVDMWLRLVSLYHATYIPERTCISRLHERNMTRDFPGAGAWDFAKASIKFLNQHSFPKIFPLVNIKNADAAHEAVKNALDIAATASGSLYALGPHLCLFGRILEWVTNNNNEQIRARVWQIIKRRTKHIAREHSGTDFGFLWKVASVVSRLTALPPYTYRPVQPAAVAEKNYWNLSRQGNPSAEALKRYLAEFEQKRLLDLATDWSEYPKEVVFVLKDGAAEFVSAYNGESDWVRSVLEHLRKSGTNVLVLNPSGDGLALNGGALMLGVHGRSALAEALRLLSPIDVLVAPSGTDVLRGTFARRFVAWEEQTDLNSLQPMFSEGPRLQFLRIIKKAPMHKTWRKMIYDGSLRLGKYRREICRLFSGRLDPSAHVAHRSIIKFRRQHAISTVLQDFNRDRRRIDAAHGLLQVVSTYPSAGKTRFFWGACRRIFLG